jgi:hypothetical protein
MSDTDTTAGVNTGELVTVRRAVLWNVLDVAWSQVDRLPHEVDAMEACYVALGETHPRLMAEDHWAGVEW